MGIRCVALAAPPAPVPHTPAHTACSGDSRARVIWFRRRARGYSLHARTHAHRRSGSRQWRAPVRHGSLRPGGDASTSRSMGAGAASRQTQHAAAATSVRSSVRAADGVAPCWQRVPAILPGALAVYRSTTAFKRVSFKNRSSSSSQRQSQRARCLSWVRARSSCPFPMMATSSFC